MDKKPMTNQGLMKLFYILDQNNDKHITADELRDGLNYFGFDNLDVEAFMAKYDVDKDGKISLDEYKQAFNIPMDQLEDFQKPITKTMTKEMCASLFERLDKNSDGRLSKDELYTGMSVLGATKDEIKTLREFLDMDDDGYITRSEYRIALCMWKEPTINWERLFQSLDTDASGTLSVSELKRIFDCVGIPILHSGMMQWISEYDKNKDGQLDYAEFLSFVSKQRNKTKW